jgi:hypothetical protein
VRTESVNGLEVSSTANMVATTGVDLTAQIFEEVHKLPSWIEKGV